MTETDGNGVVEGSGEVNDEHGDAGLSSFLDEAIPVGAEDNDTAHEEINDEGKLETVLVEETDTDDGPSTAPTDVDVTTTVAPSAPTERIFGTKRGPSGLIFHFGWDQISETKRVGFFEFKRQTETEMKFTRVFPDPRCAAILDLVQMDGTGEIIFAGINENDLAYLGRWRFGNLDKGEAESVVSLGELSEHLTSINNIIPDNIGGYIVTASGIVEGQKFSFVIRYDADLKIKKVSAFSEASDPANPVPVGMMILRVLVAEDGAIFVAGLSMEGERHLSAVFKLNPDLEIVGFQRIESETVVHILVNTMMIIADGEDVPPYLNVMCIIIDASEKVMTLSVKFDLNLNVLSVPKPEAGDDASVIDSPADETPAPEAA